MFLAVAMAIILSIEIISPYQPKNPPPPQPPAVEIYVERYYEEKSRYCPNVKNRNYHRIPIVMESLGRTPVGLCIMWGSLRNIKIDTKFWADANESEREELIFHELGHCDLDREHTPDRKVYYANRMIYSSIMHVSDFIPSWDYWDLREYYMKELFEGYCSVSSSK